jgi:hypothetical protein
MLEQIVTALLPNQVNSLGSRRVSAAALLLFPVALAAGFFLLVRNTPPSPVRVSISRPQSIEIARRFLLHEGIPVGTWTESSNFTTDEILLNFVNARQERSGLWKIAPPVSAVVKFRAPGGDETAQVSVSVDGRVLGFE